MPSLRNFVLLRLGLVMCITGLAGLIAGHTLRLLADADDRFGSAVAHHDDRGLVVTRKVAV